MRDALGDVSPKGSQEKKYIRDQRPVEPVKAAPKPSCSSDLPCGHDLWKKPPDPVRGRPGAGVHMRCTAGMGEHCAKPHRRHVGLAEIVEHGVDLAVEIGV